MNLEFSHPPSPRSLTRDAGMNDPPADDDSVHDPPADSDTTEPAYLWSDLLARRNALGLTVEDAASVLNLWRDKLREAEEGDREVMTTLVKEFIAMERFVADHADEILAAAPTEGVVTLQAAVDQAEFEAKYPNACTLRDNVAYPVALQHVAVGRAAAELSRRGREVEVHRGERRADLLVRRLAAGLLKLETATLLGSNITHYDRMERSRTAPPAGVVAELQAINDFITDVADQLEVVEDGGVSIVMMIDDQAGYERLYPQAKTRRDGNPYPRRLARVAAARRAHTLQRLGKLVYIAAADDTGPSNDN